ncbi:MAG: ABC transporter ATP-binding protein [Rubrivivax sp.]
MAQVSLYHLSKRYAPGSGLAVHDVNLQIEHGELFVLLGPSGCGKSTTLRMIAGLEAISDGELHIDGRCVNGVPAKDRDIAMVFQSYALYPHMSVSDNLAFGLRRRGFDRVEIDRRVAQAAQILELEPYLSRKPHALSGGQRQRVAVGRAIVRDPKVFLFDEPLSNLDAALRVSTRAELTALHARLNATIIYVTHDQVEAMTMGTRICIMNGGRVEQVGRPLYVYRKPANLFVAGFLGSPPMNLIDAGLATDAGSARLKMGAQSLDASALTARLAGAETRQVGVLGIRPEDVHIGSADGLAAEVLNSEALGAETLVQLKLPGVDKPIRARLDRDFIPPRGEQVRLNFDLARARLFDASSGQALPFTDD